MEIVRVQVSELSKTANWLEKMNKQPEHNVGYCGTEAHEILQQLQYDLQNGDETTIVVAKEGENIIGLIGLDIDEESAEVWGPFSTKEDYAIEQALLQKIKGLFPNVKELAFYINKMNDKQIQFLKQQKAEKLGDHLFLIATKDDFIKSESITTVRYDESYYEAVVALHDTAFPETYYDGTTIIRRATKMDHCHLLLAVEKDELLGYSYFEVDHYTNEACINYILIDESHRGKGLGSKLLQEVLQVIFANEAINEVQLSMNAENKHAYNMFLQAGFKKHNELLYYVLK